MDNYEFNARRKGASKYTAEINSKYVKEHDLELTGAAAPVAMEGDKEVIEAFGGLFRS